MKFVNTVELKTHLNAVVADVAQGETVIVTLRGKPVATLLPTTEEDLDQILFERSATVRKAVTEGLADLEAGRFVTVRDYAARRFGPAPKVLKTRR